MAIGWRTSAAASVAATIRVRAFERVTIIGMLL
jgi:hypothetical protein